jgi:ribosomal protein S18 acetylase RimI-like enzyme
VAVRVRPATEADYPVAGDLCVAAYLADGQLVGPAARYGERLRDIASRAAHGDVLVAETDDGTVVGCVTFVMAGSPLAEAASADVAEFRMLATDPAAQGRGVGRALMDACLDLAAARGCQAVAIFVRGGNDVARRMYEKRGFVRVPEMDWSPLPGVDLKGLLIELS